MPLPVEVRLHIEQANKHRLESERALRGLRLLRRVTKKYARRLRRTMVFTRVTDGKYSTTKLYRKFKRQAVAKNLWSEDLVELMSRLILRGNVEMAAMMQLTGEMGRRKNT